MGGRNGLASVDDSKELQVLIPKWHDDVRRASARMMSAFEHHESEGLHVAPSGDEIANEDNRLYQSVSHGQILTEAIAQTYLTDVSKQRTTARHGKIAQNVAVRGCALSYRGRSFSARWW
jgi:hypothetical protein